MALAELDVEHRPEELNTDWPGYPLANKILAAAAAERRCSEEILVWVDSDSLFTGEPAELELGPGINAGARPTMFGHVGSTGPGHPRDESWVRLYELCGAEAGDVRMETSISREWLRPYWNSGLVAVRRDAGVFGRWLENFRRVTEAGYEPPVGGRYLTEEMTLSGTLAVDPGRVERLSWRYNHPLPWKERLADPQRSARLDALVHVHYFDAFARPGALDAVEAPGAGRSAPARWLEASDLGSLASGEERETWLRKEVARLTRRSSRLAAKLERADRQAVKAKAKLAEARRDRPAGRRLGRPRGGRG